MKINSPIYNYLLFFLLLGFFTSCDNNSNDTSLIADLPIVEIGNNIFSNPDSAIIVQKATELDNKFNRLVKLTGFNGTVLYAEKGRIILQKAYGFQNVRRKKDSLKISDAFQLASVSKMFTAMAIMILKNDGKVTYDEDIRTYLPDFPYEGVTIQQLLTHRSGLPRYMSVAHDKWTNKKIPMDNDDMFDLFVEYTPNMYFSPNSGFHYCNTNYAMLANIIEAVSNMHFEDFIEARIFEPLEMNNSFVYNMRGDSSVPLYIDEGVPGYYHKGWRWREMTNEYLNGVMGDKNIYTSVEDLYKYDRAMDSFTLLPDSVISEAFEGGSPSYWKRKNNYGFGWRIKNDMDSTAYHFGWWKGFRTFYMRDMKHQKTLIVLTNKDKGPGSSNLWNIMKADTLPFGRTWEVNY